MQTLCFNELLAEISPYSPVYQRENKFRIQVNIGASCLWKFQKVVLELSFLSFGFKIEMSKMVNNHQPAKLHQIFFLVIAMHRFIKFLRIKRKSEIIEYLYKRANKIDTGKMIVIYACSQLAINFLVNVILKMRYNEKAFDRV